MIKPIIKCTLFLVLFSAGSITLAREPNRLIFYLHGRILEEQGLGAKSEVFGHYDYEGIVQELGRDGHTVVSEIRGKNTDPSTYAEKVAADIRKRIADGIPASHITVVGASKGAAITVLVSNLLRNRQIKYVTLAICAEQTNDYFEKKGVCVYGEVLSVYETSDEMAGSCESLFNRCSSELAAHEEIATSLGNGHGMVYKPYEEWIGPTLRWAGR
jgi:hypothetical protein